MVHPTDIPGLLCRERALVTRAHDLCARYGLAPLARAPVAGLYLQLDADGLVLFEAGDRRHAALIRPDFTGGALAHRLRYGGGRGQPLARAAGIKPGFEPVVWDATAGLGRDGFVLASLGCRVTLCERNPVLAALLDEALERARLAADIGPWVSERLRLRHGDSARLLPTLGGVEQPDTIYLDPMYPPGKDSTRAKKEMHTIQRLVGHPDDEAALLEAALAGARRRVVVKRPRRAPPLAGRKPSASIQSKKTRYDIHVTL
ncbi:MAG TPA: hypothetical protein ENJ79_09440 [Gammaproteobacteria bacterium]|nr:hypothetical protein [Gammaproteobacteria bacterium]